MSNDNNAPFVSTANYAAATGVSTSPFTDQRAVIEGGGGGGGAGNMVYENGSINVDDGSGTGTVKITTVDQGEDNFNIGTASAKVSFEVFDGPNPGDPSIQAITASCNGDIGIQSNQNVTALALNNITLAAAMGNIGASAAGDLTLGGSDITATASSDMTLTAASSTVSAQGFVTITGENVTVGATQEFFVTSDTVKMESANTCEIESGKVTINSNDCKITTGTTPQPTGTPYFEIVDAVSGASFKCLRPASSGGTDAVRMEGFGIFDMTGDLQFDQTQRLITQRWMTPQNPAQTNQDYLTVTNTPQLESLKFLRYNGAGIGTPASPKQLEWGPIQSADLPTGSDVTALELNYDTASSVLVLSDPALPPASQIISTTSVVPGRTILIDDILVSGVAEQSAIGLSNTVFPPVAIPQLIGNNPPLVAFPNALGVSSWFPGASFRAVMSGTTNDLDNNENLILRVYSNRGQPSENVLNTFNLELESVGTFNSLGWKWEINFTCRSVNNGGILGVIATNSAFSYTDDQFTPTPEGFIISNVNSSFDTGVTQYLDFTFDFQSTGNSLTTNLFTIERIF